MNPLAPPPMLDAPVRPWPGPNPAAAAPDPFRAGPPPTSRASLERRLRKVRKLREERGREALAVYEPVPGAVPFHASPAKVRLVIGSNRASKTFAAATEVVMLAAGVHPSYPTKEGGIEVYVVGRDEDHLATLWQKLASPGQFKILKDPRTGKWRPVRPDAEFDKARRDDWRDAPPILPERFLKPKGIAWQSKNKGVPKRVRFRNGSRMTFFTSGGPPRRGFDIDLGWIDEEPENREWIVQMDRGLTDRNGRMIVSCTPESGTQWLYQNWREAKSPWNLDLPPERRRIDGFHLLIADNPYIPDEGKRNFFAALGNDPDRLRIARDGEFAIGQRLVYRDFNTDRETGHVCPAFWPGADWNRYLWVDPGITRAAVAFVAVAPDVDDVGRPHPHAGEVHVYDELYPQGLGAKGIAQRVGQAVESDPNAAKSGSFVAFGIDGRAGRQTQMGSQRTIESDFREAFREEGLSSRLTGSSFIHGSDNVRSREEAVHQLLAPSFTHVRGRLRVHDRCRFLLAEIPLQLRKVDRDGLVHEERIDKNNHLVTTLEYHAHYDRPWFRMTPVGKDGSDEVWEEFLASKRKRQAGGFVRLGPPPN